MMTLYNILLLTESQAKKAKQLYMDDILPHFAPISN
jgi:hypothetical protein